MKDRNDPIKCPSCGSTCELLVSRPTARCWKPLVLNHVEDKPVRFNTEQSLKDYCRRNGVESSALL